MEGAEYQLLQGALNLILRDKSIIVFETGNITLPKISEWFEDISYSVHFLQHFPSKEPISKTEFLDKSASNGEYNFVAYPKMINFQKIK